MENLPIISDRFRMQLNPDAVEETDAVKENPLAVP